MPPPRRRLRDSAAPAQAAPRNDDIDQLRKTVRQLGAEVSRLKAENAKLEKYRQVDYLREQLLKEERRVETLQKELADIGARETSLQNRLDEIEPQLRPTKSPRLAPASDQCGRRKIATP